MTLKDRIQNEMKTALRAQDKPRLGAVRLILAAVKQREVDERIELGDDQVLTVLERMVKQRRDSISQYQDAGRDDLVATEQFELEIIQEFLPTALTEVELDALINAAIAETDAQSMRDMGKVMGLLKQRAQGRAEMGAVSARVKALLSN